jgi:hypothetical protein
MMRFHPIPPAVAVLPLFPPVVGVDRARFCAGCRLGGHLVAAAQLLLAHGKYPGRSLSFALVAETAVLDESSLVVAAVGGVVAVAGIVSFTPTKKRSRRVTIVDQVIATND